MIRKGAANGYAPNQNACKGRFRKRHGRSFLATQAAGAKPILAPGRPTNEGLLHHVRSRSGGGFGHKKQLSDLAGFGLRQRRQHEQPGRGDAGVIVTRFRRETQPPQGWR